MLALTPKLIALTLLPLMQAPPVVNTASVSATSTQTPSLDEPIAYETSETSTVVLTSTATLPGLAPIVPPGPLEETVVRASLLSAPGSSHLVTEAELERHEYDDPHAILTRVPGVYTRGEDGVGLRPNIGVRGVNPDRSKKLTLLEDGILFGPAPYSAPAAYYFPLVTRMTSIQVVKGPSAISQGPQTVGGAIDLQTRPVPRELTGAADVGGGAFGYRKAHAYFGYGDGKLGFLVEGVHLGTSGFKELLDDADTGFVRNDWMLKARYRFDPVGEIENTLELKASYGDESSNETYLGLADADLEASPNLRYPASKLDHMDWHRTAISLTHRLEAGPTLSVETTGYRHDLSRVWRKVNGFRRANLFSVLSDPEAPRNAIYYAILTGQLESSSPDEALLIGPNDRSFVSQGVESRLRWAPRTGPFEHAIEAGLRLHNDSIRRRHTEDAYLVQGEALVPEGSPTVTTAFNEAWSLAVAAHALDAVTFGPLTLTPGIRAEVIRSEFSDFISNADQGGWTAVPLPGIGAFVDVYGGLGLLAGVHRGFSPPVPSLAEITEPELSVNYEAGARFQRWGFRGELIGYYNDYSNLTDVCTLSSGCLDQDLDRQFDAGEARIYGLEALAEYNRRLGPVSLLLSAAYTLTFAEFENTFVSDDPIYGNVVAGDEVPYVPRHQTSGTLALESEYGGANLSAVYVSPMREVAGSEPLSAALATDDQLVFDAGIYGRFLERFELYLNVRNLFDRQTIVSRRPFGARPNAPRWVQLGLKVYLF